MIKHQIKHYYQPTNHSCSQSALAMVLSHFGKDLSPEELIAQIPVNKNDKGEELGTLNQQLATWCLSQGFDVELHTADFELVDLSWATLPKQKMLERMELAKDQREIPALGKEWSKNYLQSYVDFVSAGGQLHIEPYMTTTLLDDLLLRGPVLLCVCYNVLYGEGRTKATGLRASKPDDLTGNLTNHSIVLYGKNDDDTYMVADPWREPGLHTVVPECLLAAMSAAQMECDNLLFQLKPNIE